LIYDETDLLVPFEHGIDLNEILEEAHFVHTKGIGNHKIISNQKIIGYLTEQLKSTEVTLI
jgi:hypothetical protein